MELALADVCLFQDCVVKLLRRRLIVSEEAVGVVSRIHDGGVGGKGKNRKKSTNYSMEKERLEDSATNLRVDLVIDE